MRIGIDIDVLRWERAGVYNYLWGLLEAMCRLGRADDLSLFLYGKPWVDKEEQRRRWRRAFPGAALRYYFDGVSPLLLCRGRGPYPPGVRRLLRAVDRRVLLPLWRRALLAPPPGLARLWARQAPSRTVDLLHHPSGVLLPLHARANVMTVHDLVPIRLPETCRDDVVDWFNVSYVAYVHRMDLVICDSEQTRQDVINRLGVEADRTRTILPAAHERYRPIADGDVVQEVLVRHGLQGRPYVLTLSTLEPRKNLTRLLEAFHQLRGQEPSLIHRLVVVGARGWKSDPIFETIRRLGLEDEVAWLGYVAAEELPALYSGAELFALPSLFEGFGLPALEAMACGTPVLTSRVSSLPEVVGDSGLLVDPYQVGEIAEGMRQILTNGGLRATLAAKGLARARLFSWEKTARLTLDAYAEAVERSRQTPRRSRQGMKNPYQRRRMEEIIDSVIAGYQVDAG